MLKPSLKKSLLEQFMQNIERYKVYFIILLFTLFFLFTLFKSFYGAHLTIKEYAEKNRELLAKDIQNTISLWLEDRLNYLESITMHLNDSEAAQSEKEIIGFLKRNDKNRYFDIIQLVVPKKHIYAGDTKAIDFTNHKMESWNEWEEKMDWYRKTAVKMQTTFAIMPVHRVLLTTSINICTPIKNNSELSAVVCGVLKLDSIFERIERLNFLHKAYYFISDEEGKILTYFGNNIINFEDDSIKKELENALKLAAIDNSVRSIEIKDNIISLSKFGEFDWFVGVGASKENYLQESIKEMTKNSIISMLVFALLMAVAHLAHEYLRKRSEAKQREYEFILAHRSRIQEIGGLISGINHQLKQPINSIALVVSNTLGLSKQGLLDKETLEGNLELCKKAVMLLSQTFGIFRNFYRHSENISSFLLLDCIKNVLHVTYIELTSHNIKVIVDEESMEGLEVVSMENFIQQILLVLIQNAKDAITLNSDHQASPKEIKIEAKNEDGCIFLDVTDWGCGVSKESEAELFSEFKSSKKYGGTGIGLYFSKKMAMLKLDGNLVLASSANPTTFRLIFPKNIKDKNCKSKH